MQTSFVTRPWSLSWNSRLTSFLFRCGGFRAGRATAEGEAAGPAGAVPNLEQQIVQQENALSILLGRNPEDITRGRGVFEVTIPEVPVGLSSILLVRRPDILAAEQNLVAAMPASAPPERSTSRVCL